MSNWRVVSAVLVVLCLCAAQASAQKLRRSLNNCGSCSIEGDWFSVEYMTTNCTGHDNCIVSQKYYRKVNFDEIRLSEKVTVEQIITMSDESVAGAVTSVDSNDAECVIYNYANDLEFKDCTIYGQFVDDNCFVYDNKDEFDTEYFTCRPNANCKNSLMEVPVVFSADCNTLAYKPNGDLDSNTVYLIRDSSAGGLFISASALLSALALFLL